MSWKYNRRRYIKPTCSRGELLGQILECSEAASSQKLQQTYSCVDKSDRMAKIFDISRRTTSEQKVFSYLVVIIIL
jgi:hypothetical protein